MCVCVCLTFGPFGIYPLVRHLVEYTGVPDRGPLAKGNKTYRGLMPYWVPKRS